MRTLSRIGKGETGVINRQAIFEKPSVVDGEQSRTMFVEDPPIRRVVALEARRSSGERRSEGGKIAKTLGISVDDLLS